MKNILVPTDFSKNAENALYYAMVLAKKVNAKLILLHAYQIDYTNSYVPYSQVAEEKSEANKESEIQLKTLCLKVAHAGDIRYETLSVEASPVEAILDAVKKKKIDLIVMGTKGATGLSGAIFGSNTAKVIEKSKCPVIAVPAEAGFKSIRKITYATAYNPAEVNALVKLAEIAEPLKAQIIVAHVSDTALSPESEEHLRETFTREVLQKIEYGNLIFQTLTAQNVEAALEKHIDDGSTHMLVLSAHHRDFFDKIFGKSLTKYMVNHAKIPLMVFHYNGESTVNIF